MSKNYVLHAWKDVNSLLRTHKLINLSLILICILQVLVIFVMYFNDPIVVIQNGENQRYLSGQRVNIPISEETVKIFVKDFLKIRYEWKEFDPKSMSKSLSPIATKSLNNKLFDLLTMEEKEFRGKKTSQAITNISVSVSQDEVVASFDKLLKIEGIPIPIPTTVSLNIVRGSSNAWNPVGLFVNGIIESKSK